MSGAQVWNGTAATLKANPAMNIKVPRANRGSIVGVVVASLAR